MFSKLEVQLRFNLFCSRQNNTGTHECGFYYVSSSHKTKCYRHHPVHNSIGTRHPHHR